MGFLSVFTRFFQDEVSSPFAAVANRCHMSSAQLDSYLRAEIRSLRRRKLIPKRSCIDVEERKDENIATKRDSTPPPRKENNYRVPGSPQVPFLFDCVVPRNMIKLLKIFQLSPLYFESC